MSNITEIEIALLDSIKTQIELLAGQQSPTNLAQKDYEYFVFLIENETGVSISLSTIKRIWLNKNDRLPHIATLNALSMLAFRKNWLELKREYIEKLNSSFWPDMKNKQVKKLLIIFTIVYTLLGILLFIVMYLSFRTNS